jgi:cell division protein FtsQ
MSPIFNIETIKINGNDKISATECINLSGLENGQNIYKLSKKQIKDNIKQNAYIESVSVSRKLPNVVEITIKERQATYMLELENNEYAYINNQGYILEKSYEKIQAIIITGFSTPIENINVGSRLSENDLNKLEVVLKIADSANSNNLLEYITKINIEDKTDYQLYLESERKTVHLGDTSSIGTRMLYLKAILEKEQGIEGEVFINGNMNTDEVFFREKV